MGVGSCKLFILYLSLAISSNVTFPPKELEQNFQGWNTPARNETILLSTINLNIAIAKI